MLRIILLKFSSQPTVPRIVTGPREPFDDWPLQFVEPRFGYAWYVTPGTLITHSTIDHGTVDAAHGVNDIIERVVPRKASDYDQHGGLLIIHDWRSLQGYEAEARQVMLDRVRARPAGYLRRAVAILPPTPMLRMAAQTVNLLMALRGSAKLQLATDPVFVLRQFEIRAPTHSIHPSSPRAGREQQR